MEQRSNLNNRTEIFHDEQTRCGSMNRRCNPTCPMSGWQDIGQQGKAGEGAGLSAATKTTEPLQCTCTLHNKVCILHNGQYAGSKLNRVIKHITHESHTAGLALTAVTGHIPRAGWEQADELAAMQQHQHKQHPMCCHMMGTGTQD